MVRQGVGRMSKIYVDLRALENSEQRLRRLTREFEGINERFKSIRNSLDRDVRYSRGIDGQFSELSVQLSEEVQMLFRSTNHLKKAVEAYEAAEKIINKSLQKINTDTKLKKKFDIFEDAVPKSHTGGNGKFKTKIKSYNDEDVLKGDENLTEEQIEAIIDDIKNGLFNSIGFDPSRPGRLWDKIWEKKFTILPIFWTDISLEFALEEAFGVDTDTYREWRHTILEIGGFIPGPVGPVCDILDAAASFREGQWVDGLSSIVFAIPALGDAVGALKLKPVQEAFLGLADATNEAFQDIIDANMDEIRDGIDRITDDLSEIIVDKIIDIPPPIWQPNYIQELIWESLNWTPAIPNPPLLTDLWGLNDVAKRFVNSENNKDDSSVWNKLATLF